MGVERRQNLGPCDMDDSGGRGCVWVSEEGIGEVTGMPASRGACSVNNIKLIIIESKGSVLPVITRYIPF